MKEETHHLFFAALALVIFELLLSYVPATGLLADAARLLIAWLPGVSYLASLSEGALAPYFLATLLSLPVKTAAFVVELSRLTPDRYAFYLPSPINRQRVLVRDYLRGIDPNPSRMTWAVAQHLYALLLVLFSVGNAFVWLYGFDRVAGANASVIKLIVLSSGMGGYHLWLLWSLLCTGFIAALLAAALIILRDYVRVLSGTATEEAR